MRTAEHRTSAQHRHVRIVLLLLLLLSASFFVPKGVSALTTDNSQYTLDEALNGGITATCDDPADSILQLYDITNGTDNNFPIGARPCGSISMDSSTYVGQKFALLELTVGRCDYETYDDCKNESFFLGEADITIGDTAIPNSGGGGGGGTEPPSLYLDKSVYASGETVRAYCQLPSDALELYDISFGVDEVPSDGLNVENFPCGSPSTFSFDGMSGHTYALLEYAPQGQDCSLQTQTYTDCQSAGYLRGEVDFAVSGPDVGSRPPQPTITITAPKAGTVFSHTGTLNYATTHTSNTLIFYSDKLGVWDNLLVDTNDLPLIQKGGPAQGPFTWDTSALTPGVWYRAVIDAMNANQTDFTQAVSNLFSVDFSAPQFVVGADPPVARGGDITITVDSSKALGSAPTTTVTQQGGTPIAVAMQGSLPGQSGTHFTGTYQVVDGHDGIAVITVSGTDMVGNTGSTVVSGGTFAVGVDPPPAPVVTAPDNNTVTGTSTVTITGTTRPDTTIEVAVNGIDAYRVKPQADGTFTVSGIALDPKWNRGVNVVSVTALDAAGLVSEATPISIKYNIAPTVAIDAPLAGTTLGGLSDLSVKAADVNGDPLQFTYQIIEAAQYNPALDVQASSTLSATLAASSSTSTAAGGNQWTTVGDAIPSSGFQWDATEVADGPYLLRVIADDGIARTYSAPVPFSVRNTAPIFHFEDGRETIVGTSSATVVGHVQTPDTVVPQASLSKLEYSRDGKHWIPISLGAASGTPEASFSVTFRGMKAGTYGVLWRATDSTGLAGIANHPVIVDMTPPGRPTVVSPALDTVVTDSDDVDSVQSGVQVNISGTAEMQSTVTLAFASSTMTTRAGADGSFVFRDISVAHGTNTFSVFATDEAGNIGTSTVSDFIYDNPPVVSILSPKQFRGLTGKATVTWSITDKDNVPVQHVTLSFRRGTGAWTVLGSDLTGTSFDWDVSALPPSRDYQLKLEASDGIQTASDIVNFSVDNTPPAVTSFTLANDVIGQSGTLQASGTASDDLSGIEYVEYAIVSGGAPDWYTALVTGGFLEQHASFSITYPSTLPDGTYHVLVRAVDGAGNVSPPVSHDIIVDTSPPRIGSFAVVQDGVRTPPDSRGNITVYALATSTFSVSLEGDTASASLTLGGKNIPLARDIASGLWEADFMTGTGTAPILLSAEDNVHNAYAQKPIGSFVAVDRGIVTARLSDGTSQPLSGAGIRVLVLDESGNFVPLTSSVSHGAGDVVTAGDGSYELTLPAGTYELVAHASGYQTQMQTLTLNAPAPVHAAFGTEAISPIRAFIQSIFDHFRYSL